jgi:threonine/homoserine/homoserine lactone efflux protein
MEALVRVAPAFAEIIRVGGAAYLGYLAFVTWRSAGGATIPKTRNGARGSVLSRTSALIRPTLEDVERYRMDGGP